MLFSILIPLGVIALDQAVKHWAATSVRAAGTIPLLEGVFHFTYVENRGGAFGILQNQMWFFILATVAIVGVLLWFLKKQYVRNLWGRLGVLFLVGGAIGNLIDRVCRGYVVDMFDFRLINFAVFNVADIFITAGGIMNLIYFLFMDKKLLGAEGKEEEEGNDEPADA